MYILSTIGPWQSRQTRRAGNLIAIL